MKNVICIKWVGNKKQRKCQVMKWYVKYDHILAHIYLYMIEKNVEEFFSAIHRFYEFFFLEFFLLNIFLILVYSVTVVIIFPPLGSWLFLNGRIVMYFFPFFFKVI